MSIPPPNPITPAEAKHRKGSTFPPEVIRAFNDYLSDHYGPEIIIQQDTIIDIILIAMPHVKRQGIFDNGWLDIESVYKKAGWSVEYDKPAYNETYPASWTFKPGK